MAARFCVVCGVAAEALRPAPVPLVGWLGQFRRVPWRVLVDPRGARAFPHAAVFALLAGAPFLIYQLVVEGTLGAHGLGLAFGAYFALVWLLGFAVVLRPEALSARLAAGVVACSALVGVAGAAIAEGIASLAADPHGILSWTFEVGLVEECAKALPVLAFLHLRRRSARLATSIYVGLLSGFGFGVAEAVIYTVGYHHAALAHGASPELAAVQIVRLAASPLLHACWAGIAACFLALASRERDLAVALSVVGILLAGVLHGAFDDLGGWGAVAVAGGSAALFAALAEGCEGMAARLRLRRATAV